MSTAFVACSTRCARRAAAGHIAYWFLMGLLLIFLVFYYGAFGGGSLTCPPVQSVDVTDASCRGNAPFPQ